MAQQLFYYISCLIILTYCVDQGDGRWRKRDRGNLHHDVDVFRTMGEKINAEIEALYEDYFDKEDYPKDDLKNARKPPPCLLIDSVKKPKQNVSLTEDLENITPNHRTSETKNKKNNFTEKQERVKYKNSLIKNINSHANWPKFEDILLEMGKRYDWKNDRWIKVKGKLKGEKKLGNTITFLMKHKFSYRLVKLNRKSRRNVIAVSAVR